MIDRFQTLIESSSGARRLFLLLLVGLTLLRAALAAGLPFTSDEAYFTTWGMNPDWGFYDHPPMIGWWLAPLVSLSLDPFVLRLPALVAPPFVALVAVAMLRRHGEALAWTGGSLVLLVPLNAVNVAVTTDIPLMIFSALTVLCYLRAQRTGRNFDSLLAGLMLGGALLSKYFAGLLAIAIFLHSVWRPDRRRLVGLAWVVLGSLPSAAIQVAWNSQHCWPNLMFNLVNRHENAGWSWNTPLLYALSVVYVLTPAVAWRLLRGEAGAAPAAEGAGPADAGSDVGSKASSDARSEARVLRWLALVPFAIFALLSPLKTIGLHWLASFVLPSVLVFVLLAGRRALARGIAVAFGIAAAHWALIAVLLAVPTEAFRKWDGYGGLVMTMHADELARALEPRQDRFEIASIGYSPAVTLGHALGRHVFVFGVGSSHARHDDILTDVREFAGRDILIVAREDRLDPPGDYPMDHDSFDYRPYFDRVVFRRLELRGAGFLLVEGYGFRYEPYRDNVLQEIRSRWYQVPARLPAGPCYFCDRYFGGRACHREARR